jgi:ligand-binding SRPBCC domain-containing protein
MRRIGRECTVRRHSGQRGPFASFHDEHRFEQHGETATLDVVRYERPLGPLGPLGAITDAALVAA